MWHIAVIEDQALVREILMEVAQELGESCQVHSAASLSEARELLRRQPCHCLVTDLQLGDGESLELIRELREAGETMPIILVSAFLSPDRLRQARALGVDYTLPKPFKPQDLQRLLKQCLPLKARVVPFPKAGHRAGMLPELFELDRQLTLLDRMLEVLSKRADVAEICATSVEMALDISHADCGFIALLENGERLLMASIAGDDRDQALAGAPDACPLKATPFAPLFRGGRRYAEGMTGGERECWPGVTADYWFAMPITLQGTPAGVLCIMHRRDSGDFQPMELRMLGHLIHEVDTMLDNRAVHAALGASVKESLIAMARILDARDRYTKNHSARVSSMGVRFARALGLDERQVQMVRTGGLLHDIGKVGISDAVLLKPGRYTDREYAIMKTHPALGDHLLKPVDMLVEERRIVRLHHERWDGRGYPDGLKGEAIPVEARIICVADAIDAMTTHRVYRQAQPLSFCIEQLQHNSGTQFDQAVVEVAIAAIEGGKIRTLAAHQAGPMPRLGVSA